jgi:hypothetical protein
METPAWPGFPVFGTRFQAAAAEADFVMGIITTRTSDFLPFRVRVSARDNRAIQDVDPRPARSSSS